MNKVLYQFNQLQYALLTLPLSIVKAKVFEYNHIITKFHIAFIQYTLSNINYREIS